MSEERALRIAEQEIGFLGPLPAFGVPLDDPEFSVVFSAEGKKGLEQYNSIIGPSEMFAEVRSDLIGLRRAVRMSRAEHRPLPMSVKQWRDNVRAQYTYAMMKPLRKLKPAPHISRNRLAYLPNDPQSRANRYAIHNTVINYYFDWLLTDELRDAVLSVFNPEPITFFTDTTRLGVIAGLASQQSGDDHTVTRGITAVDDWDTLMSLPLSWAASALLGMEQ